eukprot:395537_1
MDSDIAAFKRCFMNKQWVLAKKLILEIHLKHKENTTILCKLGDCCMKLHEYDLAKQCYIRCINNDKHYFETENAKYYLKLAHVYQIYYDPYCSKNDSEQLHESQLLFQKALSLIDSSNNISNKLIQKCYFFYAQLLTKLQQYNLAESYYEKLISFNKNKSVHHSVHYYYAKVLFMSWNKYSTKKQKLILDHFQKAIKLNPSSKYVNSYVNVLQAFATLDHAAQTNICGLRL